MNSVDCLLLDAKHAILDEHHRRFQSLHDEGRFDEAMKQFQVTLTCASDVLNDALRLLDDTLQAHRRAFLLDPPSQITSDKPRAVD